MRRRGIGAAAVLAAALLLPGAADARRRRQDPPQDPTLAQVAQAKQQVQQKRSLLEQLDARESQTLLEMNTLSNETTNAGNMNTMTYKLKRLEDVKRVYDETSAQKISVTEDYRDAGEDYIEAENAYAAKNNGKRYDPNEYVYWVNELRYHKATGGIAPQQNVQKSDPAQTPEAATPKASGTRGAPTVHSPVRTSQAVGQGMRPGSLPPQPAGAPPPASGRGAAPGSVAAPAASDWLERKVMLSEPLPRNQKAGITLQSLDSIMGKLRSGNAKGALREADDADAMHDVIRRAEQAVVERI